jgi:hypothetical protein
MCAPVASAAVARKMIGTRFRAPTVVDRGSTTGATLTIELSSPPPSLVIIATDPYATKTPA